MAVQTITYPLTLPLVPAPTRTRFRLEYAIGRARSPFSRRGQKQDWGGRQWFAEVTLAPMRRAVADEWIATGALLHGGYGTFRLGDWDRRVPRGIVSGTPLVDGAGQIGNIVAVKSLAALTAGLWLRGDHIQIGDHLHMVVSASVDSDTGGRANIQIEPDLRESPADAAPVIYSAPKGLFELAEDSLPWESDAAMTHGISFTAEESLS